MKRYTVREFGGATAIKDNKPLFSRLYPFGYTRLVTFHEHRRLYTAADAQAVCDWLNERETWPEFQKEKQNALL